MGVEESVERHESRGEGRLAPGRGPKPGVAKTIVWLAVLLIVASAVAYRGIYTRVRAAAEVKVETRELAVPSVSVIRPKQSAPQQEIILPGNVQAFIEAPIYSRTTGYLKRWYVDIGGRVKNGQLLAEIDTPELDQQLQQARAELATAKANYELAQTTAARYEFLLKSDSVSKQDVDNAVGDEHAKKAMVDSASDNVKRLEQLQSFEKVYAPFDGVLTARETDIGQLIVANSSASAAKELFRVASINPLRVYVNVPQVDSPAAVPGVQAYLTMPQYPGRRFPGKIVRNAEAIEQASRTLLTEVDVANPTGEILPGAYAEVHLKLPSATSTVIIPVTSLLFRSEGLRVAVVRQGHAVMLPITLGRDFGTEVEVVSGLGGNEAVITNPPDSLVDGEEVRVAGPGENHWGAE
ncbi:MAG TPA: efflux RND transporter periplasmic adaptor subunit [Terriglobia bacterium]|nr:efflux RND transporter periplasmic adaptor subunit [Terriglobia bacterium]